MVSAFRSFANLTSHTLRRSFGWKNGKLLEDSVFRTVCSHLVLCCNMSPRCVRTMGVCRALALFGDAKQATVREKVVRSRTATIASFPGPRPASRRLQYCKRREAGRGPGNEATATIHLRCDLISRKWAFFYKMAAFCST